MLFKVERGGSIIAQSSTIISYSNNTIIGTLAKPLELQFVKQAGEITVYPNPVTSKGFTVNFGQVTPGNYELQLTSQSGQVVYSTVKYIVITDNIKFIQLGKYTASGTYQLSISGPAGYRENRQVIVE